MCVCVFSPRPIVEKGVTMPNQPQPSVHVLSHDLAHALALAPVRVSSVEPTNARLQHGRGRAASVENHPNRSHPTPHQSQHTPIHTHTRTHTYTYIHRQTEKDIDMRHTSLQQNLFVPHRLTERKRECGERNRKSKRGNACL